MTSGWETFTISKIRNSKTGIGFGSDVGKNNLPLHEKGK